MHRKTRRQQTQIELKKILIRYKINLFSVKVV